MRIPSNKKKRCASGGARTHDLQLIRLPLYRLSYRSMTKSLPNKHTLNWHKCVYLYALRTCLNANNISVMHTIARAIRSNCPNASSQLTMHKNANNVSNVISFAMLKMLQALSFFARTVSVSLCNAWQTVLEQIHRCSMRDAKTYHVAAYLEW